MIQIHLLEIIHLTKELLRFRNESFCIGLEITVWFTGHANRCDSLSLLEVQAELFSRAKELERGACSVNQAVSGEHFCKLWIINYDSLKENDENREPEDEIIEEIPPKIVLSNVEVPKSNSNIDRENDSGAFWFFQNFFLRVVHQVKLIKTP